MNHARRAAAFSATALLLCAGLSGCGSKDKPDTQGPASSSATPTPTSASPTPSPTPTAAPLSRFEDQPVVKAARAAMVAYSTDINNQDANATQLVAAMVPNSRALALKYEKTDLDQKGYQPGPVPFTPTSVKRAGSSVNVFACMQFQGWAINKTTKQPLDARRTIKGVRMNLKRISGQWKLVLVNTNGTVSCDGVAVKGVPWS